jgi:hypothetical protein
MTDVRAPELYEPKQRHTRHDDYLRENAGVSVEMLAADLGVSEGFVRMRQRKLGLRKCGASEDV